MCGISGYIYLDNRPATPELNRKMANTIKHRGPDHQGEYIEANMAFAHRRLSVIDLSNHANQPMSDSENEIILTYNGEIYNYKQLRDELKSLGHNFRTSSDTEVILNAYKEWGTDSFIKLNGMFAFSILDKRSNSNDVYIVRDRVGIKPLFYHKTNSELSFASELKPLLVTPWIKKNVCPQTLFYYLKHGHIPTPLSIIEGVAQLSPGHYIHLKNNHFTIKKYWSSNSLLSNNLIQSESELIATLDETMLDITRRQVISDVPVGCFLSGGIDSSLLVAYYAQVSNKPITTFAIGYKEAEFDESYFAKIVAEKFKTKHHEIIIGPKDMFDIIPNIPKFYDQPFSDPTLMPTMLLSNFAKNHVTVALSGDGGDELFFGYVYHEMLYKMQLLKRIPHLIRRGMFESLRQLIGICMRGKLPLKIQQIRKFLEIMQFKDSSEFLQYFVGTIGPLRMDRVADLVVGHTSTTPSLYAPMMAEMNDLKWHEKVEQVFIKTFMLDTVLQKSDRASMAHSLEVRVPFLDNKLLDLSARVPFSYKYKNGVKKHILRELLKEKLPPEIVDRKKQGFSIPLREWLRGDLKYLVNDYLNPETLKKDGFLNHVHVQKVIDDHMNERANNSHLIWSMICFGLWKEEYL